MVNCGGNCVYSTLRVLNLRAYPVFTLLYAVVSVFPFSIIYIYYKLHNNKVANETELYSYRSIYYNFNKLNSEFNRMARC
jgi:hypothetical protein